MNSSEKSILSQEFVSNLIERSLNEIYVFDANTLNFLFVNRGACLNLGYSREEMLSLNPIDIKPEYSKAEFDSLVEPLRDGLKEKVIFETIHERKDGSRYPVEVHLQMLDFKGERCFVAIILDISKRIAKESEIKEVNKKLKNSNDELTQFAYRASHDLKAPLTTIKGLTILMKEDLVNQDFDEVLKNIDQVMNHSVRLENLVTDILKLAKADLAGSLVEDVNLLKLVEQLVERNSEFAETKSVNCKLSISSDMNLKLEKARLQQIIENLLHNSIKYSSKDRDGSYVQISAQKNDELKIVIEDNGVGIPVEKHADVFTMFSRFHPNMADGSGLGMSIVKKGIETMGGQINFDSNPSGTTFTITLPLGDSL